jgi:photosynthetic reaction center H subunit
MVDISTNDAPAQETADAPSRVIPLSEVDDFEVADGYPEIRGWDVRDSGGRSIGYVYDLLVDIEALRVRYLDVELEPEFAGSDLDQRVLIPLESVGLDGSREEVLLHGIEAADVHTLVPYARRGVAREQEMPLAAASGLADGGVTAPSVVESELRRERHYDDERLFGRDSASALSDPGMRPESSESPRIDSARTLDATSLVPSEVSLAGVTVRKTVDTERARERVAVDREEVEIERRAVRPGEDLRAADVQGDEIRIPIMAEELVVEKRLVTKEVLVIRKRRVAEERTVEADLRRERVEVDDPLGRVRSLGEAAGGPEGRA